MIEIVGLAERVDSTIQVVGDVLKVPSELAMVDISLTTVSSKGAIMASVLLTASQNSHDCQSSFMQRES